MMKLTKADLRRPDVVSYRGCYSINLADGVKPPTAEGVFINQRLVHVAAGRVQITPSGGLVGYVGETNEKVFGLYHDLFVEVFDHNQVLLWPLPKSA